MKQSILTSFFLLSMLGVSKQSTAQSLTSIKNKAILVARQAGYTTGPLSKIVASANQIGTCGTASVQKIKYEVYVAPKSTPTTRMAPFARVTMCGLTVLLVEKLR